MDRLTAARFTTGMYPVLLVVALVLSGLYAGVFFAFTVAVMPGLARAGDGVLVETMQEINRAIVNPAFAVVFVGSPLLAVAAAVLGPATDRGWLWAGAALVVATLVVTVAAGIPLNNALDRAGRTPDEARAARTAFTGPWVRWNLVRTLLSAAGLACLVIAAAL